MASVPSTVFGNLAIHWDEPIVMEALGYKSEQAFSIALMRAKQACLSLGIQCEEHFVRQTNGSHAITRFGCYLVAMNGDPKKPEVAAAQAYFAAIAETFQDRLEHAEAIERILVSGEVTDKTELAANLFCITQIEQKITKENIRGQQRIEKAAFDVVQGVRRAMQEISGTMPNELPIAATNLVDRTGAGVSPVT